MGEHHLPQAQARRAEPGMIALVTTDEGIRRCHDLIRQLRPHHDDPDHLVACVRLQQQEGYLLAAAMLREQAVACMVTLNFDLAMSTALTYLGATDVPVVAGPEDHHLLGVINLIYLHRNVDADPEEWVLRTSALADDWRDC